MAENTKREKFVSAEEASAALESVRQHRRGAGAITEKERQAALGVVRRFISQKAAITSQKAAKVKEDTQRLRAKKNTKG